MVVLIGDVPYDARSCTLVQSLRHMSWKATWRSAYATVGFQLASTSARSRTGEPSRRSCGGVVADRLERREPAVTVLVETADEALVDERHQATRRLRA